VIALFAGLVSIFIFTSAEDAPAAPPQAGQGPGAYTVAEIAEPGGFLTALPTVSTLAGVILLALWAIAVATDYSKGLIRILAQAHPSRTRLLGGKIAALSVFTLLATPVTTLVVVLFARPLARLEGIPIEAWKTDFASELGKGFFDFTIAGLVWGLIGLMLAVLTRSSAIAIGIGLTLDTLAAGGNDQLAWCRARAGRPLRRHRRHCLPYGVPHPRHRLLTCASVPPKEEGHDRHDHETLRRPESARSRASAQEGESLAALRPHER
jgi:ABC-type transport system involved in multi-copper enzyme maturation permease subunit